VALVPAAFMMVMTMTALVWVLVTDYLPKRNWVLSAADIILLVLSTAVLALSVRFVVRLRNHADARAAARA
jgi:phosphate starvation-inducible membrane PsiE